MAGGGSAVLSVSLWVLCVAVCTGFRLWFVQPHTASRFLPESQGFARRRKDLLGSVSSMGVSVLWQESGQGGEAGRDNLANQMDLIVEVQSAKEKWKKEGGAEGEEEEAEEITSGVTEILSEIQERASNVTLEMDKNIEMTKEGVGEIVKLMSEIEEFAVQQELNPKVVDELTTLRKAKEEAESLLNFLDVERSGLVSAVDCYQRLSKHEQTYKKASDAAMGSYSKAQSTYQKLVPKYKENKSVLVDSTLPLFMELKQEVTDFYRETWKAETKLLKVRKRLRKLEKSARAVHEALVEAQETIREIGDSLDKVSDVFTVVLPRDFEGGLPTTKALNVLFRLFHTTVRAEREQLEVTGEFLQRMKKLMTESPALYDLEKGNIDSKHLDLAFGFESAQTAKAVKSRASADQSWVADIEDDVSQPMAKATDSEPSPEAEGNIQEPLQETRAETEAQLVESVP